MTCLDCKHLFFDGGEPGYSEWTPGEPMSLGCKKKHWDDYDLDNADDLRECFGMADDCKDFERIDVKALKKKVLGE